MQHIPFMGKLMQCMMCLSFWIGMILYLFNYDFDIYSMFIYGCYFSGTTWILYHIQLLLESVATYYGSE